MSAASAIPPPRRGPGRPRKQATPVETDTRTIFEKRRDGLNGIAQLGQGALLMGSQWADAAAIGRFFPPIADELAKISETNEFIAKPVDFLIQVGPYGALITAAMPLVLQLMANHNMVNANAVANMGVVAPEVLEAQMKAEVLRMQAEAMQMQRLAMEEAREAQMELEKMLAEEAEMEANTNEPASV